MQSLQKPMSPRARPGATRTPVQRATQASIGERPSEQEIAAVKLLLEPWQWLTAPKFYGLEHIPTDRPFLLVGNHTLMGVLDVPLLILGLYERRGVFVRSLGDHLHYRIPVWRDLLTRFGAVEGTRDNCRALMRADEPILVFPGGGREVFKHKGERYRLIWKNRLGFVRLAIEQGYPIVPFAAVGAEECYDILIDSDEIRATPIGRVLERFVQRADEIPPLVRGLGPLPKPQRFYFKFSRLIATKPLAGRQDDEAVCLELRTRVQRAIESGIRFLLRKRAADPHRELPARLLARLGRVVSSRPAVPAGSASAPGVRRRGRNR